MEDRINDLVLRRMLGEDSGSCPVCESKCDNAPSVNNSKWGLKGYPLAMVYSTVQEFENINDLDCALSSGTIFKELDLPFMGVTVTKGGKCRG